MINTWSIITILFVYLFNKIIIYLCTLSQDDNKPIIVAKKTETLYYYICYVVNNK